MATQKAQAPKQLIAIARQIKSLAVAYAPISKTAPKLKKHQKRKIVKIKGKTYNLTSSFAGNLRRTLSSYNTDQNMIVDNNGVTEIQFNYAPPGAIYGKFMNDSFMHWRSHKKVGPFSPKKSTIGFADKALQDPKVKALVHDYAVAVGEEAKIALISALQSLGTK
jgi:hypothetical protein